MAALATTTKYHGSLSLPSPAQVALALIVVKSKPTQMSIQDYLAQIRSVAVKASEAGAEETQLHFDGAALWKAAYEDSEGSKKKLLDKIFELENQYSATVGRADAGSVPSLEANSKRKRGKKSTAREGHSSKRLLLDVDVVKNLGFNADFSVVDKDIFGSPPGGSLEFMRSFYDLRAALNARSCASNAFELAARRFCQSCLSFLVDLTPAAGQEPTTNGPTPGQLERPRSHLRSACAAVQNTYPSLLQALDGANKGGEIEKHGRSIVVELVGLFGGLLERIYSLAVQEAKENAQSRQTISARLRKRPNPLQGTGRKTPADRREVCTVFTQLLLHMITSLRLENKSHASVFEGMMCLFLDHLGSSLSVAVFATGGGIKGEKTLPFDVMPPRGLIAISGIEAETAVEAVQREAPFMVCLLRRFMSIVDKTGTLTESSSPYAPFPSLGGTLADDKDCFKARIKAKLQNTLLHGIFGDEHEERFRDILQRPPQADFDKELEELNSIAEEDAKDPRWFIGEVWEHLGWDILQPGRIDELAVRGLNLSP